MNHDDFENELRTDFILEAREMLQETESAFLDLETDPTDPDIIDRIFRLAHTIKGSAYAAGFNGLAEFGHIFETLLGRIRNGEVEIDSEIVDTLLLGNDTLTRYVHHLEADFESEVNVDTAAAAINKHLNTGTPSTPKAPTTGYVEVSEGFHLFEDTPEETADETTERPQKEPQGAEPSQRSTFKNHSQMKDQSFSVLSEESARVLIVDDEEHVLDILEYYIEEEGMSTIRASDGTEALEIAESQVIDLIISDINMPQMSGLEFVEKVREKNSSIPIIFVSGAANREDILQCLNLGGFCLLEKPFDEGHLVLQIKNALKFKIIWDSTVKLARLNFKAYVASSKLAQMANDNDPEERAYIKRSLEDILQQISRLTNHILGQKFHQKAS